MLKEKIKALLREQRRTVKELSEYISMTDAGIRKIYERDSCEISTLKLIAEFFKVPITHFFEAPTVEITDNTSSFNSNADEIIKELTSIIKAQEERIRQLTDKLLNL